MTKDELIAHLENILGSAKHLLEGANSIDDSASVQPGSPGEDTAVGTSSSPPPGEPPAAEQDIVRPAEGSVQDEPEVLVAPPVTAENIATEAPPASAPAPAAPPVASPTPEELQAAAALMRAAGYRVEPG